MAGSAFFTAAAGLRNHQLRIDVVANNIANVNTTGYKGSSLIFADVLSQMVRGASAPSGSLGGINPTQVGLGMQVAAIHNVMSQAALENTSRQTDFAVNGNGFFVLSNGKENIYTRAGDFNIDRDGRLVSNNGYRVQGYTTTNADGTEITPSGVVSDIIIEFGKKLEAKGSSWLDFRSNLDANSFRYGSADNEHANVGTTGIQTFAGASEPWAIAVGNPVTAISGGPETMTINGVTVTYDSSGAADLQSAAQMVADSINVDPTLSPQVQATVRELNGQYQVVLQSVASGTSIDVTAVSDPASAGVIVNLYNPQPEPGAFLVGNNQITVTDAKAATDTTTVPVGTGANRPVAGDSFVINGVTVTLGTSAGLTDTAAQNAVLVANAINNTANITVTATANPNGTVSLAHNYAGKQRQPAGAPVDAVNADIFIDATATAGLAARYGFNTLDGWAVGALGPDAGIIDNGENAKAELIFTPDDGTPPLQRYYEDWAYDRSIAAGPLGPTFYDASTLDNVEAAIEGAGATFPLVPGVNVSIETLKAGQANFRTETAFQHTTSRTVYDSLGNGHDLTVTFTHVKENEWQYDISLPGEPNITLSNTSGRIQFSSQGLISSGNPLTPVTFQAPGADPSTIEMRFDGGGDPILGITQYTSPTTTAAREQDGYPMGVLTDFETDNNGTIMAFYNNGQRRPIARLALGTFTNPEGLERTGDTAFRPTTNSGSPVLLQPGTGSAGAVFAGYLEQSNVDLAQEFTQMIITQRGLQANSRVFTTQDEILNEIVNLKR
ncbi:flagellar hook-basal body complex protein [bacterium]|nr:flagellar hook-basal body complex protein [bacterium]